MVQLHVAGAIGGVVAVAPAANNAVAKTFMMRIDNVEENETTVVKLKLNKLCTRYQINCSLPGTPKQ